MTRADPKRGERLRMAREACGLSQAELAESLNVPSRYVSRVEKGKNLPRRQALRFAGILGRTVQELYDGPLEQEIPIDADAERGLRFRAAREWRELGQASLAESLGVAQPYVSGVEKGKHLTRRQALRFARILGRSVHELYDGPLEQEIIMDGDAGRHPTHVSRQTETFCSAIDAACQDQVDLGGIARGHVRLDSAVLRRCIEPCQVLLRAFNDCGSSWDFRAITWPLKVVQGIGEQANATGLIDGEPLLFEALDKYGHAYRYFADPKALDAATLVTRQRMRNIKDRHPNDLILRLAYHASEIDFLKITSGNDLTKLRRASEFASVVEGPIPSHAGPRPYYLIRSFAALAAKTATPEQMDRVLNEGEVRIKRDLARLFEQAHCFEGFAKAAADFSGRPDIDHRARNQYAARAITFWKMNQEILKRLKVGGVKFSEYEDRASRLPIDLALAGVTDLIDVRGLPRGEGLLERINEALHLAKHKGNPRAISRLLSDRKEAIAKARQDRNTR